MHNSEKNQEPFEISENTFLEIRMAGINEMLQEAGINAEMLVMENGYPMVLVGRDEAVPIFLLYQKEEDEEDQRYLLTAMAVVKTDTKKTFILNLVNDTLRLSHIRLISPGEVMFQAIRPEFGGILSSDELMFFLNQFIDEVSMLEMFQGNEQRG